MLPGFGPQFAILSALATVISTVGSITQGRAQQNQAEAQAAILRQQAKRERLVSEQSAEDFQREQSRLIARRRALTGGAGVEVGSGSPLLTAEDFASEAELQRRRILAGGITSSTRLQQQAALEEASGESDFNRGLFRGGSLLISGATRAFGSRRTSNRRSLLGN